MGGPFPGPIFPDDVFPPDVFPGTGEEEEGGVTPVAVGGARHVAPAPISQRYQGDMYSLMSVYRAAED